MLSTALVASRVDEENVDPEELDDGSEVPLVSFSAAANSLETVCTFLLQQDGTEE